MTDYSGFLLHLLELWGEGSLSEHHCAWTLKKGGSSTTILPSLDSVSIPPTSQSQHVWSCGERVSSVLLAPPLLIFLAKCGSACVTRNPECSLHALNKGEREEKMFKSLISMSCSTEEEPQNDPEFCLVCSLLLIPSQLAQWQRTCLPMQETQETWVQSLDQEDPLE